MQNNPNRETENELSRSVINPLSRAMDLLELSRPQFEEFILKQGKTPEHWASLPDDFEIREVDDIKPAEILLSFNWILYSIFLELLKQSYKYRNPMLGSFRLFLTRLSGLSRYDDCTFKLADVVVPAAFLSADTITLIGDTGHGKTTATNWALAAIPQLITHHQINGQPFEFEQITYVKFNAGGSTSPNDIVVSLLAAIDAVVGTRYSNQYEKVKELSPLQNAVKKVLSIYAVGMVIVDEGQNLAIQFKSSEKITSVGAFLEELFNACGVSTVVLVNTEGYQKLQQLSQLVRKLSTLPPMKFEPKARNSAAFIKIVTVTLENAGMTLNPEIKDQQLDEIFNYTSGVLDFISRIIKAIVISAKRDKRSVVSMEDIYVSGEAIKEPISPAMGAIKLKGAKKHASK